MPTPRKLVWLLALALFAFACRPSGPAASVELTSCRLDGLSVPAKCGSIMVPEDRENPEGRIIELRLAVVPAGTREAKPDPLFLLVGGPGQAATEVAPIIAGLLSEVRRDRDIVLVDQRGTGGSSPLDCASPDKDPDELRLTGLFPKEELTECLAGLDADPRLYTTPIAMDDLDAVRAALGYERINLWGGSYGSRAALVYLRMYPERVRTVILDGVVPPNYRLPLYIARDSQLALEAMLTRCSADETCEAAFPDLKGRLETLLLRLEQPETVKIVHPRTGRPQEVELDRDGLAIGLLRLLYSPQLVSLLPRTIFQAADGELEPFFAQLLAAGGDGSGRLYPGMMLSVACTEDVAGITEEEAESLSSGTLLGASYTKAFIEACSIWPRGELPEGYHLPVASDAPALILSGALDPVTPPSWGEEAASTLPSARHLIVPGAGHGVIAFGCVPKIVAEFLSAGSPAELDFGCADTARPPEFFQDFAGPRP